MQSQGIDKTEHTFVGEDAASEKIRQLEKENEQLKEELKEAKKQVEEAIQAQKAAEEELEKNKSIMKEVYQRTEERLEQINNLNTGVGK